ncbi:fluoride efflux transporter CrcB [uncultured Erythrobacter sp.]|uniref:fluoride efflux transporter CrcB n=1 Tax=uncultured Erythrobacter sp. TaxID=263913 RepID=UPI0026380FE0|nr:fluoride efflux transporter CrcB [uncultured Erythrobacter sp.]
MTSLALSPLVGSLYVALGGAVGAVARYQLGRAVTHIAGPNTGFPWATLSANIIGSLAMGLLAGWLARHTSGGESSEALRLLIGVGLLGGFTTFSAFSLEMMLLIERGSSALAFSYALVSVVAGLAALYIGLVAMRGAA